jgi:hypothetical protein
MPQSLTIILVEKTGELKTLNVKDYKEDELFKKCGFKKADDFSKQIDWGCKIDGQKYTISMYGKSEGKANMENKYDFPPPVDSKLYFGCCALVAQSRDEVNKKSLCNLSLELWNKIYEKLFGGFEDLTVVKAEEDDDLEEDELDTVPKSKKTKSGGYLKDGFVVDDDDNDDGDDDMSGSSDDSDDETGDDVDDNDNTGDDGIILEDIGSELSEDNYDYSDSETPKQ